MIPSAEDLAAMLRQQPSPSVPELARLYGVHESTVYRWIDKAGLQPPTAAEGPLTARLEVRTSTASRERWRGAAGRAGLSVTEWARRALDAAAEQV